MDKLITNRLNYTLHHSYTLNKQELVLVI